MGGTGVGACYSFFRMPFYGKGSANLTPTPTPAVSVCSVYVVATSVFTFVCAKSVFVGRGFPCKVSSSPTDRNVFLEQSAGATGICDKVIGKGNCMEPTDGKPSTTIWRPTCSKQFSAMRRIFEGRLCCVCQTNGSRHRPQEKGM